MGREIQGSTMPSEFCPSIGIRQKGNFVKGKVENVGVTVNGNPVVTLTLIDLDGTSQRSVSKGVYADVDVSVGDRVSLIGTSKQLKDKLPQLAVGDIVTVTNNGKTMLGNGRTMNNHKVEVEE